MIFEKVSGDFVLAVRFNPAHTHVATPIAQELYTPNNAMNSATAPELAPALSAPAHGDDDVSLAIIDWELGVVDQNCRKLLRVLAGIEQTYAGISSETLEGRARLKKQLDQLQLEKADCREKREAMLLKLSQQPGLRVLPIHEMH